MKSSRHRLLRLAAIAALAAASGAAIAKTPADPAASRGDLGAVPLDDDDRGDGQETDAGTTPPSPTDPAVSSPPLLVSLSGGASGSIASVGEGWTTWRYGRSKGRVPVDETTSRVRVSGSGRTVDGLRVSFSAAVLVPTLRVGPCDATHSLARVASAWARRERGDGPPDIEWDGSAGDAGPASFTLTVTSIAEASHSSDRRGGVTVDVTGYRLHGTIDATLPCTRSVPSLKPTCTAETIRGEF